jgi:hypothetical protein|tara:strand:- start:1170 stop:1595 length:426 start_codon:yes stop_codon:yes gene_type:complete
MIIENVKQIKMVNGDEIICEILEELEDDLIVRYCLLIDKFRTKNTEEEYTTTLYVLKPWMTYVEQNDEVITVNAYHCMALATPHSELMKQYEVALSRIIEMSREEENEKEGKNNVLEFEEDSEVKNVVTLSFNNTPKNKLH